MRAWRVRVQGGSKFHLEPGKILGLTIDWNDSEEYIDILMPGYVKKFLNRLQHPKPKIPKYASHSWSVPAYGKILQMAPDPYKSDIIDKNATKIIQ